MYSVNILKNKELCAVVCIDEKNNNIGFVSFNDLELKTILKYIVSMPYLLLCTSDKIDSFYVEMEEHVTVKDKRFVDALKNNLQDYLISEPKQYEEKTMQQILLDAKNAN